MTLDSDEPLYSLECPPVPNASCVLDDNCTCWNSSVPGLDGSETLQNEDDYVPYDERPETYIVPVVFALIFVVGVVGNGTLVLIFIRHRKMRNVPNTYIFSLALGDLLVIVTCVPFISTLYTVSTKSIRKLETESSLKTNDSIKVDSVHVLQLDSRPCRERICRASECSVWRVNSGVFLI
jgi:hypothetical protein